MTIWFVQDGDETKGPYSTSELKDLANNSLLGLETPIRSTRTNDKWISAGELPGLASIINAVSTGRDVPIDIQPHTPPLQPDRRQDVSIWSKHRLVFVLALIVGAFVIGALFGYGTRYVLEQVDAGPGDKAYDQLFLLCGMAMQAAIEAQRSDPELERILSDAGGVMNAYAQESGTRRLGHFFRGESGAPAPVSRDLRVQVREQLYRLRDHLESHYPDVIDEAKGDVNLADLF